MKSALINQATMIVENIIMANPAVDSAPEGYMLVALPDDSQVSMGWMYDLDTQQFLEQELYRP